MTQPALSGYQISDFPFDPPKAANRAFASSAATLIKMTLLSLSPASLLASISSSAPIVNRFAILRASPLYVPNLFALSSPRIGSFPRSQLPRRL
ncbi:hypothetical protein SNOG_12171 [Parastagonospora nodorum SN15]|uniref:Uncharacterized protein n=1 Tax=Phaeosphaeria nodorum (strain SN15 / ATCC MYA-4574 / FGSC 10173) TaxID=321614 RepID=Q0U7U3_PHANO|nr:hypothetical protein SNOG_12171 [Parastagonospora nodorum SN15]EAT80583.1 hypothetical protein SNOG_12171 [Parastagonospora nodorum SN15]